MQTEVESLRALVYHTTAKYLPLEKNIMAHPKEAQEVAMLASMCKLKAGRVAREVTDACLQYWGGQGYMWETPIARALPRRAAGQHRGGARTK